MLFSFALELQDLWDIRNKPGDEISDDVNSELKHKDEGQASSNHVPILFILLVWRGTIKVTCIPRIK